MKSILNTLTYGTGTYNENGSLWKQRFYFFFLREILNWLFLPFLIITCFNIRTDRNDVQRRTKQEFVARVYLPSLGCLIIRKENNAEVLDLLTMPCKNWYYVVTTELRLLGILENETQMAALDDNVRGKPNYLRRQWQPKRYTCGLAHVQFTHIAFVSFLQASSTYTPQLLVSASGSRGRIRHSVGATRSLIPGKQWSICATLPPPDS